MEKERQPGLDLVRAAAIFFVIVLHGITMRGALDAALLTPVWCAKVFVRYLALSAVPLFLMLSGYLQAGKRPTKAYYRGILPLYLSYFAIAALCMAAQTYRAYVGGCRPCGPHCIRSLTFQLTATPGILRCISGCFC